MLWRLAPIVGIWEQVDNVPGARAFVEEVKRRKTSFESERTYPDPLDYWAGWAALGLLAVSIPLIYIRLFKSNRASDS